jgi:hypothetical protein
VARPSGFIAGTPLGKFKTQALLCTDLQAKSHQIAEWCVHRWQLEVTFREVREHLGVETQRHWSALTIARTTPAVLGVYSLITVLAHRSAGQDPDTADRLVPQAAPYLQRCGSGRAL